MNCTARIAAEALRTQSKARFPGSPCGDPCAYLPSYCCRLSMLQVVLMPPRTLYTVDTTR